jgi:MoxR-like ATPase
MDRRKAVSIDDIKHVVHPALRHRLFLSFEAQADEVAPDEILDQVIEAVPEP